MVLASTRLESYELKRMLRRIAAESTFTDVFQIYEAHIARVEHEAQILGDRNVQLELRRLEQQQHQRYGQQQHKQTASTATHGIPDEKQEGDEKHCLQPSSVSPPRELRGKPVTAGKINNRCENPRDEE